MSDYLKLVGETAKLLIEIGRVKGILETKEERIKQLEAEVAALRAGGKIE